MWRKCLMAVNTAGHREHWEPELEQHISECVCYFLMGRTIFLCFFPVWG